jgi:predicted lysophospholipase L1 biosynthesis ABC-type transport system permease subunit
MKMSALSVCSGILAFGGGILLFIALLAGGASILSYMERLRHGPGLLFADVEILGFIALACAITGGAAVFGAWRLLRRKQRNVS